MTDIQQRLDAVRRRIAAAEHVSHRQAGSVTLIAVSKGHPVAVLRRAAAAGQRRFGESYVQEAVPKIAAMADLGIEWHFIGRLQSNKAKDISRHFAWVHSVDSLRAAQALARHRRDDAAPLNVCIQINASGERHKAGVALGEVTDLARDVAALPHLTLRGLMTLPMPGDDFVEQRRVFKLVHDAWQACRAEGLALDTLSMGMSQDLEAAISQGATLVRVGTAVFGRRPTGAPQHE